MTSAPETTSDPLAAPFASMRSGGRRALIPYVTAGYPTPALTRPLLAALVRAGADVIELGIPFSDPVADGPTIQRSSQVALDHGVTPAWALDVLRDFRGEYSTPIVIFTYLNPILRRGAETYIAEAAAAGAHGILVTDLPSGADPELEEMLETGPLAHVRLVAPTTPPARAAMIASRAQGFLYYISRTGVTGATRDLRRDLGAEVESLRAVSPVPVAVGFGISSPEQAAEVARVADGVVVGSALIDALDSGGIEEAGRFLAGLRAAIDEAAG